MMDDTKSIVARANLYGFAALAFMYPDDRVLNDIRDGASHMTEALGLPGTDPRTAAAGLKLVEAGAGTTLSTKKEDYNGLFVGKQQVRMDESEYDQSIFNRYQRMADVAGFYRAFGFEVAADSHQRADFIGTELEFMRLLLLKQAYAIEQGWEDKAEACRDAASKFCEEHLEWWVPVMCEKLEGAVTCAYYLCLSNFLKSFMRSEASGYGRPRQNGS